MAEHDHQIVEIGDEDEIQPIKPVVTSPPTSEGPIELEAKVNNNEAGFGSGQNREEFFKKMAADAAADEFHVEMNENDWLYFIPNMPFKISLTIATVIMALLGAGIGLAVAFTDPYDKDGNWDKILSFPGTIWVRALKLLVLPLIILMMLVLPSRVDEIGFIGTRAVPLYLFTSTCAAIQGTIWAWTIQPGNVGKDPGTANETLADSGVTELDAFLNIFYNAVPSNIVVAMSDLTILGIIIFFLAIGMLLRRATVPNEERSAILNISRGLLRCVMMAVVWVVWFTPFGMFSLILSKLAVTDDLRQLLIALGAYLGCVLVGHTVHVFGFYPAVFWCTTRGNGWKWFSKIYGAPVMAFATSSSAATLPRSLQVADDAGVRRDIYSFVLPLGAAINMDGTAMGFPIMIGLIAQLNDVTMTFAQIIIVLILSVIVSVGTAPIPNAGMVYLTMLFAAAGLEEYTEEGIAILFVLDWFVDRIETAVNVTSDQFVSKIMDDVDMNSKKKEYNVVCGCCMSKKRPGHMADSHSVEMQQKK